MTRQADFKRRVRARMAKTGESYATARSRLLGGHPDMTPGDSPIDWMPEALHVSNGDATDVPGTGLARRVIYWRDVLHEGPDGAGTAPAAPPRPAGSYAARCGGGAWFLRICLPSGLRASIVPSGWRVIFQPQRWMQVS